MSQSIAKSIGEWFWPPPSEEAEILNGIHSEALHFVIKTNQCSVWTMCEVLTLKSRAASMLMTSTFTPTCKKLFWYQHLIAGDICQKEWAEMDADGVRVIYWKAGRQIQSLGQRTGYGKAISKQHTQRNIKNKSQEKISIKTRVAITETTGMISSDARYKLNITLHWVWCESFL